MSWCILLCIWFSNCKWLRCLCDDVQVEPLKPICFPQMSDPTYPLHNPCSLLHIIQNFPPLRKTCLTLLITTLHLPQCIPTLSWPLPTYLICIFHLRTQFFARLQPQKGSVSKNTTTLDNRSCSLLLLALFKLAQGKTDSSPVLVYSSVKSGILTQRAIFLISCHP